MHVGGMDADVQPFGDLVGSKSLGGPSHDLALPASLPDAKKTELEQLAKLSGPEFDRQYVKLVGVQGHHKDIAEFEKASQAAGSPDVREFAQSTLPALKKHLAAAQKLPGAKG